MPDINPKENIATFQTKEKVQLSSASGSTLATFQRNMRLPSACALTASSYYN
jgi:hypothetical protein